VPRRSRHPPDGQRFQIVWRPPRVGSAERGDRRDRCEAHPKRERGRHSSFTCHRRRARDAPSPETSRGRVDPMALQLCVDSGTRPSVGAANGPRAVPQFFSPDNPQAVKECTAARTLREGATSSAMIAGDAPLFLALPGRAPRVRDARSGVASFHRGGFGRVKEFVDAAVAAVGRDQTRHDRGDRQWIGSFPPRHLDDAQAVRRTRTCALQDQRHFFERTAAM